MAARLNTKLVVILLVSLGVLGVGTVTLSYLVVRANPERYREQGDALAAQKKWRDAEQAYRKAVNRDQANITYIDLWRTALANAVPMDETQAREDFQWITVLLKKKTELQPTNALFLREYLEHLHDVARTSGSPDDFGLLYDEAAGVLKRTQGESDGATTARRYRGIAGVSRIAAGAITDDASWTVKDDLTATLERNPDDIDAATALTSWYSVQARLLRTRNQSAQADSLLEEGLAQAAKFAAAHSQSAQAEFSLAAITKAAAFQRGGNSDATALSDILAEAERRADLDTSAPWQVLLNLASEIAVSDPENGNERALALVERAGKMRPASPSILLARADLYTRAGDSAEAIRTLQAISALPNLPTGIDSVALFTMRRAARLAEFEVQADRWTAAPAGGDDAASARARVLELRAQYAQLTTQTDETLAYMDGRIALGDGNNDLAARKMGEYQRATGGDDFRAALYESTALLRLGQKGAAYDALLRANSMAGGRHVPVLVQLASIDLESGKYDQASQYVDSALALAPESREARSLKDRIDLARGQTPTFGQEPELAALLQAQQAVQNTGDLAAALDPLAAALAKNPQSVRLMSELASIHYSLNNLTESSRYVDMGLAISPGNEMLQILRTRIAGGDLKALLQSLVDARPGLSTVERLLAKATELSRFGFDADAESMYTQAAQAEPDNAKIMESEFLRALEKKDLTRAEVLTRRAAQLDSDQAQGLTFAGRLALARGDANGAIATFQQAARIKPYDGAVQRFLAVAQREAGQHAESLSSFRASLDRRPDDVATLREYAALQLLTEDTQGALASIRQAATYAPGDALVQRMYLDLEGRFGDRARVIAMRKSRYERNNSDIENALALIDLYILNNQRDLARSILDALSPAEPAAQLRVVQLRAQWLYAGGDLAGAKAAFSTYVAGLTDRVRKLDALLAYARFLVSASLSEEALAAAGQAVAFQDPANCEADRFLGDYLMTLSRPGDALAHYAAARAGNPTVGNLSLRMAEINANLAQQAQDGGDAARSTQYRSEASALIKDYVAQFGPNVESALLEARLLADGGDRAGAAAAIARAIAAYAGDKRVYLMRGQFALQDLRSGANTGAQLVADANKAAELDPKDSMPLRLLAQYYAGVPRADGSRTPRDLEKFKDALRRAVAADPRSDQTRLQLIDVLATSSDFTGALAVVQEGIERNPRSAQWRDIAGDLKQRRGDTSSAYLSEYQRAFEIEPSSPRLAKWVKAALDARAPSTSAQAAARFRSENARQALTILDARADIFAGDLYLSVLRARALGFAQGPDAGVQELRTLYPQIVGSGGSSIDLRALTGWYEALAAFVPVEQACGFVDDLSGGRPTEADQLLLAQILVGPAQNASGDQSLLATAIRRLESARASFESQPAAEWSRNLRTNLGRMLGDTHLRLGQAAEAVDGWMWALAADPDDVGCNNNLAFVLASDLKRPEEALPYARRAYQLAPGSPDIADTYGYVLAEAGRLEEAEGILRAGLSNGAVPALHIHLGEVLLKRNKFAEARASFQAGKDLAAKLGMANWVKRADEFMNQMTDAGSGG